MVEPDAVAQKPFEVLADRGVKTKACYFAADSRFFFFAEHAQAAEVLSFFGGGCLSEMHKVNRCPVAGD